MLFPSLKENSGSMEPRNEQPVRSTSIGEPVRALLKTSASCGLPILLKANHQLESRVPEMGLLGSEGGATSSVVPTLSAPFGYRAAGRLDRLQLWPAFSEVAQVIEAILKLNVNRCRWVIA
jgi:hypothetical protein